MRLVKALMALSLAFAASNLPHSSQALAEEGLPNSDVLAYCHIQLTGSSRWSESGKVDCTPGPKWIRLFNSSEGSIGTAEDLLKVAAKKATSNGTSLGLAMVKIQSYAHEFDRFVLKSHSCYQAPDSTKAGCDLLFDYFYDDN